MEKTAFIKDPYVVACYKLLAEMLAMMFTKNGLMEMALFKYTRSAFGMQTLTGSLTQGWVFQGKKVDWIS